MYLDPLSYGVPYGTPKKGVQNSRDFVQNSPGSERPLTLNLQVYSITGPHIHSMKGHKYNRTQMFWPGHLRQDAKSWPGHLCPIVLLPLRSTCILTSSGCLEFHRRGWR